jgi:hypothetical protein
MNNLGITLEQIRTQAPDLTSDDLTEVLVEEIEREIARALRTLELPAGPTPIQRKLMEFRARRKRAPRRRSELEEMRQGEILFNYIASFQTAIDGWSSIARFEQSRLPSNSTAQAVALSGIDMHAASLGWNLPEDTYIPELQPPDYTEPIGFRRELEASGQTIPELLEIMELPGPRVILDRSLAAKCVADSVMLESIRTVEKAVVSYGQTSGQIEAIEMAVETDMELPGWERIVIKFRLPEMPFEERMRIWTALDSEVRGRLASLIESTPEMAEPIKAINRNLYLELELEGQETSAV